MLTYITGISRRRREAITKDFTPLVFGTDGGVGIECSMFLATLADKLSVVRGEDVNVTMEWLRAKLSFEVLRSALFCDLCERVKEGLV